MQKTAVKLIRWFCIVAWACIVVTSLAYYIYDPTKFSADNISSTILSLGHGALLSYTLFSLLRGFTLLPSTPLVIAGTLLFPSQPIIVFAISILGILFSSTMIYFFSDLLGFSEYFSDSKPELTKKVKTRLEHPLGSLFVALWAFFPFVPTDLVCYLAGTTRMKFAKFIIAIFIGESILCAIYIFAGGSLIRHLLG